MRKYTFYTCFVLLISLLAACDDDHLALPDLTVSFPNTTTSITEDETTATITITFSRTTDVAGTLELALTETGLTYLDDYTTSPASVNGKLHLAVPMNVNTVTFQVNKAKTTYTGEENLQFEISSLSDGLFMGENQALTLSFTEVIARNETLAPQVGGPDQPNTVYIDLSASRQTVINRATWDLGFYSAGDEFRVIINPHLAAMIRELDQTDMNQVGEPDSIGFTASMSFNSFHPTAINWTDHPSGDISQTAVAEISITDSENKVYILNRGNGIDGSSLGWKKIRILQKNGVYVLQHADIASSTFSEVEINKNAAYNFIFYHFENGKVEVEPKKAAWDIAFSVHHNFINFGSGAIPYLLKDMVFQNRTAVSTLRIDEATHGTYEAFTTTQATALSLNTEQLNIGSSWRDVFESSIHDDRFYLVKDNDGNLYKLQFNRMTLNGERGNPQFTYELLD